MNDPKVDKAVCEKVEQDLLLAMNLIDSNEQVSIRSLGKSLDAIAIVAQMISNYRARVSKKTFNSGTEIFELIEIK